MIRDGREFYYKVLDIPEGRICGDDGEFTAIEHTTHPPGYEFETTSTRTRFLGGKASLYNFEPNDPRSSEPDVTHRKVVFDVSTTWHRLAYGGGTWMTDYPIEQAQIDANLAGFKRGSVLVGGLGLGYAAVVLAERGKIDHVVVVEKSRAVVRLVEGPLRKTLGRNSDKVTIVCDDLFHFLAEVKKNGGTFERAFYDIWQSDGERTLHETVVPLLHASHGVVRNRPTCWNENVMRGQLVNALQTRVYLAEPDEIDLLSKPVAESMGGSVFHNWSVPFFAWLAAARKNGQRQDAELNAANYYATNYGARDFTQLWERFIAREEAKAAS